MKIAEVITLYRNRDRHQVTSDTVTGLFLCFYNSSKYWTKLSLTDENKLIDKHKTAQVLGHNKNKNVCEPGFGRIDISLYLYLSDK